VIFGQSALCTSTGTVTIPDPAFNVYAWNTAVSGGACPITGDYAGLGALGDDVSPNDSLIILASNSLRALLIALQR
jgi:Na+/H+ antiporter NhaC